MDYIGRLADAIRSNVPSDAIPDGDTSLLFRMYAVLVLSTGIRTTAENVHDAWGSWVGIDDPEHESLVPAEQLDAATLAQDLPYLAAIKKVARDELPTVSDLDDRLFPQGVALATDSDRSVALDLYRVMVSSSEGLVTRRQGLNTFFLTANGALVTAAGLVLGSRTETAVKLLGVGAIGLAGILFAVAWHSLLISYGQLNTGKFKIINRIERELPLAVFDAEWLALGEGKDPKLYRSFTDREIWTPRVFGGLFILALLGAIGTGIIAVFR